MNRQWLSGTVRLDHGCIAYQRTGGDKPPLITAHGLTDSGLCWTRTSEVLQDKFDVIMLDARGHGGSSLPPPNEQDDPASDLKVVCEALNLIAPVLLGHSVGGRDIAIFANTHPNIPSKVILEDPVFLRNPRAIAPEQLTAFKDQVEKFQQMTHAEIVSSGKAQHPTWPQEELVPWAAAKQKVNAEIIRYYPTRPWQQMIQNIAAPTLLIYGEAGTDGIIDNELANEVLALNENFTKVAVSGAGHNIRRENFSAYIACIKEFIEAT